MEPVEPVRVVHQEHIRRQAGVIVRIVLPVQYNQTGDRVRVLLVLQVGLIIH